jgi:hypothetical protein
MKKLVILTLVTISFSTLAMAQGQRNNEPKPAQHNGLVPGREAIAETNKVASIVTLSQEQRDKLLTLNAKLEVMQQDMAHGGRDRKLAIDDIERMRMDQYRTVLTPEQMHQVIIKTNRQ